MLLLIWPYLSSLRLGKDVEMSPRKTKYASLLKLQTQLNVSLLKVEFILSGLLFFSDPDYVHCNIQSCEISVLGSLSYTSPFQIHLFVIHINFSNCSHCYFYEGNYIPIHLSISRDFKKGNDSKSSNNSTEEISHFL